ncbi:glycoside hydrolase superfamily [Pestalotiopsis sp. NC0098]|nr:glycoside hydrolase superfamily [Pestalotiopsis sp. NC0098]
MDPNNLNSYNMNSNMNSDKMDVNEMDHNDMDFNNMDFTNTNLYNASPNNTNAYNTNTNTSHNTHYDLAPSNGPSAPDSFHHSSGFSQNSNIPMTYTDSTNLAALDMGPATIDPATEYPMIAARMASSNSTPNLYTNEAMLQGFSDRILPDHKHWRRLSSQLKWLETLGVKHVWTPPATKASSLRTDGYDVYDLYDLGEFHQKGTIATKWGTKQEFQELARAASGHGIKLIFDAVLHHKAGADAYENVTFSRTMPWQTKSQGVIQHISLGTKFEFPGRQGRYSYMKWNMNHLRGMYVRPEDTHQGVNAAFWHIIESADYKSDADEASLGNGMIKHSIVDLNRPTVRQELRNWVTWLGEQLDLGGLRIDSLQHCSGDFIRNFTTYVDQRYGSRWMIMGNRRIHPESPWRIAKWLDSVGGNICLFDISLFDRLKEFSRFRDTGAQPLLTGASLYKSRPRNAITFVSTHETHRTVGSCHTFVDE